MIEPDDSDPQGAIEGSPPVADDARCEQPADHVQQQQGGCSEAKPLLPETAPWVGNEFVRGTCDLSGGNYQRVCDRLDCACASAPTNLPGVLAMVCEKFQYLFGLRSGEASAALIDARSSLLVAGRAKTNIIDWQAIVAERDERAHR